MSDARVLRIRHVRRNVAELERSIAFYCDALGGVLIEQARHKDGRMARLRLGEQELVLFAPDAPGLPYPRQRSASDPWFQHLAIVVADVSWAYAHVCRHAFEAISEDGPQTLSPNTGLVTAFKFRDPDGHPLELIHFPAGVGDARWQQRKGLFLGIDHSALVVTDMQRSLAFYERLGFRVTARSHNRGPEQARLDGIADVDVDVVSLAPALPEPPRLELLGYRVHGKQAIDRAPNDIAADCTVMQVSDVGDGGGGLLKDPDGHWLAMDSRFRGNDGHGVTCSNSPPLRARDAPR
jgi:catechol 2,3-dioxygenase-like lactoylglutathione lyase family enzyme